MSIPLTGSGGLFTRIGHILGALNALNTARGTTLANHVATVYGDYTSADRSLAANLYTTLASYQSGGSGLASALQSLAQQTVIQMAADDAAQPNASLFNALDYLINQMTGSSDSVTACSVGASSSAASGNTGNAVVALSAKTATGKVCENAFAEAASLVCTSDSVTGSATAGQERLAYTGIASVADSLSWLWPAGSGAGSALQAISASVSQSSSARQNQLNNGNFETFTSNTPAGWVIGTGTAGTTVLKSTAQHYDGSASLQLAGNGTENTQLYQAFGVSTGTTRSLSPYTQYAVNLWVKTDSIPAAGALRIALTDGSGTVVNDTAGNANSVSIGLTTIGTTWTAVSAFFRTPRLVPSNGFRLELKLTTPLSNGVNAFVDRLALAQPTQPYPQAPAIAVFSGSTNLIAADSYTLTFTNDQGGAFQRGFDRLFGMRSLGLLLPSSGSPTISASLIA